VFWIAAHFSRSLFFLHEHFESLLNEALPKGQLWPDYTNWKNHLAGFPKELPADIEIRATSDLSVWVLYVPSTGQVVIGPEKAVKEFARKTWK
jgi:hypothetical protein